MQIVTETVTYYVAEDGEKFADKEGCLWYEKGNRLSYMIQDKTNLFRGEADEATAFILGNYEQIKELIES